MNSKKNIVLIDDDDDELVIFDLAMNDLQVNYICRHAKSSEDGLKILHVIVPDVIFLDVNMPKENGFECLKQIKQIKNMEEVPVVMYSTHMDDGTCEKALKLGATACIKKSNSIVQFTKILKRIMNTTPFAGYINEYT